MDNLVLYLLMSVPIAIVMGTIFAIRYEKRIWNNGVCSECGEKWIIFDVERSRYILYEIKRFNFSIIVPPFNRNKYAV